MRQWHLCSGTPCRAGHPGVVLAATTFYCDGKGVQWDPMFLKWVEPTIFARHLLRAFGDLFCVLCKGTMPPRTTNGILRSGVLCMFSDLLLSAVLFFIMVMSHFILPNATCWIAEMDATYLMAFVILFLWYHRLPSAGAMLMLRLACLPGVAAVCNTCFGAGIGCRVGSSDADAVCPWSSQMTENTKAMTAAVGGALVVGSLLTPRLLRVFTKPVLDTLAMVVARPAGGQPFDVAN